MQGTDALGKPFAIGDIVNVPCEVTAIGASSQNGVPILGLTCKYTTPNGSTITVATIYSSQTIIDR
jgi:hypothetical protein